MNDNSENHEFQSLELSFVGSLMPGMLHNLATPLSGVIGATQLMEMRAAEQEKIVERLGAANSSLSAELETMLKKNKTNLDIIGRNADQLIKLVEVMVQRFQRMSVRQRIPQSLNELVQNELEFLNANLAFKHKVRKEISLADEPYALNFSYSNLASVIDEFVSHTIDVHDVKQGMMEMWFATRFMDQDGHLEMKAEYKPLEHETRGIDSFGIFLARVREDGCQHSFKSTLGSVSLSLIIPK
jgi:signal transduction histidine kinase